MTKAYVLDGKAIADGVIDKVARETQALAARGVKPGLAVVLVVQYGQNCHPCCSERPHFGQPALSR